MAILKMASPKKNPNKLMPFKNSDFTACRWLVVCGPKAMISEAWGQTAIADPSKPTVGWKTPFPKYGTIYPRLPVTI
jgi:hypothetical protein